MFCWKKLLFYLYWCQRYEFYNVILLGSRTYNFE